MLYIICFNQSPIRHFTRGTFETFITEIVELDLRDKSEALDIDMTQLDLTEKSANISHKPDATRIPKG